MKHCQFTRRGFIRTTTAAAGSMLLGCSTVQRRSTSKAPAKISAKDGLAASLPKGGEPAPLPLPHFPDRLHAFVWRNWPLVPVERLAAVCGASPAEIVRLGREMGLSGPPRITGDQLRRSYISIIKRNWHLLPYEQLLELLDWSPEQLAYTLREDDFLFVKLGSLKPRCERLKYETPPPAETLTRAREIRRILQGEISTAIAQPREPLFSFVNQLSTIPLSPHAPTPLRSSGQVWTGEELGGSFSPRFCSSYFAIYGDPLLDSEIDPYPEGYLARLSESGVDGIWLQAVLYKLAPYRWDSKFSARYEERLENLIALVARARRHRIRVYLYLNEPRAMPMSFFATRPELKGVAQGDYAALCTSNVQVQNYLRTSVASICRAVPDLGGLFTITASENLTNCWSHGHAESCPRCRTRSPAEVIAEVNNVIFQGIQDAKTATSDQGLQIHPRSSVRAEKTALEKPLQGRDAVPRLIVWDWGWADDWAEAIINRLPQEVALMSVSEWSLPIERGGVHSEVGEYSISAIGPGPRAQRHWALAQSRGLKTIAKIQAGNTWELSAVPYIPAVANVAQHAANLRQAKVDGLMLGWTLGGYPSPNLEVIAALQDSEQTSAEPDGNISLVQEALHAVAVRRFGKVLAPFMVKAWLQFSAAFSEFPFHVGLVYSAPLQVGPANLLWPQPTGYSASMVGFPYDDLDSWRAVYPPDVFIAQLEKVANGFDEAIADFQKVFPEEKVAKLKASQRRSLVDELTVAEAAGIHFPSAAHQARFVIERGSLARATSAIEAGSAITALERVLPEEVALARRLYAIQSRDSRIGFEASNQYYYVPIDLGEKILNCRDLLDRWLPAERAKWQAVTAKVRPARSANEVA